MNSCRQVLEDLELVVHHGDIGPVAFDPLKGLLQAALGVLVAVGDQGANDHRALPHVVIIHLGDGEIELLAQAGDQWLEASALLFQRRTRRDVQGDGQDADGHGGLNFGIVCLERMYLVWIIPPRLWPEMAGSNCQSPANERQVTVTSNVTVTSSC